MKIIQKLALKQKQKNKIEKTTRRKSSKSKNKKIKSKPKQRKLKIKIKKGVYYMKHKYNIRVELEVNDNNLEVESNGVNNNYCIVYSNRNCVRASKNKNYNLMEEFSNDCKHISTLINPYIISIENSIEMAIIKR